MAERDYKRGEGVTPIQEMTTRQLRRYIRERAEEAQARINSIEKMKNFDISDTSRAFQNQYEYVKSFGTGRSGGIKKDTSRISKAEMAEYAYALRDLNMLDTESKYAKDIDYAENKQRYIDFIKERTRSDNRNAGDRKYWSQFLTEKGNVRKAGYTEYKNFVNFLKAIEEVKASYGYETIKDVYYDESDQTKKELVADLLIETYNENEGLGLAMSDLVDKFMEKYKEATTPTPTEAPEEPEAPKRTAPEKSTGGKPKAPRAKKPVSKKSGNNVQTKTTGKMRNGTIREKQGTKKL